MPGKRGKQSVKKGIWYLGGRYKKARKRQRGKGFLLGLLASIGAPILGEIAKPILEKYSEKEKKEENKKIKNGQKTYNFKKKSKPKNS